MKKMVLLLMLILTTFSCKALKVNNERKEYVLENEVNYNNKGTKSEEIKGSLKYKNQYIPNIFSYVTDMDNSYKFIANKEILGQHGYIPMNEKLYVSVSEKEISKEELSKGYYLGNIKLKNTPNSWIKVSWAGESAFIDIERLYNLLKEKPFVNLPNYGDNNFIYNGPMIIKN